jgi:hypothetical protein
MGFKLKSFMFQFFKDSIKNRKLKIIIDVVKIIIDLYLTLKYWNEDNINCTNKKSRLVLKSRLFLFVYG